MDVQACIWTFMLGYFGGLLYIRWEPCKTYIYIHIYIFIYVYVCVHIRICRFRVAAQLPMMESQMEHDVGDGLDN